MDSVLKWNGYDLTAQAEAIKRGAQAVDSAREDIERLLAQMDATTKASTALAALLQKIKAVSEQLDIEQITLNQCAHIYLAAENQVNRLTAELPGPGTGMTLPGGDNSSQPYPTGPPPAVRETVNSRLVMEGWLAELVYEKKTIVLKNDA
jgi:hypothetical protein